MANKEEVSAKNLRAKGWPHYCLSCKKRVRLTNLRFFRKMQWHTGCEKYFLKGECPICGKITTCWIRKAVYDKIADDFEKGDYF